MEGHSHILFFIEVILGEGMYEKINLHFSDDFDHDFDFFRGLVGVRRTKGNPGRQVRYRR